MLAPGPVHAVDVGVAPRNQLHKLLAVLGLSSFAFVACSHRTPAPKSTEAAWERQRTDAPVVTIARGGGPLSLVSAVDAITKETCRREIECNRIGRGHLYVTRDACSQDVEHETRQILNAMACQTGYIDPDALVECLTAIHASGCDHEPTVYCDTPRLCSP